MAENPPQEQQQPKFSFFNPKEWSKFIWNRVVRLPGIRRLHIGRTQVGSRRSPIETDLRGGWLDLNKRMFESILEPIEVAWSNQGKLLGSGKHGLLDNETGIVPMYKQLGIYADIEKISTELDWFEHGTGFIEEQVPFEVPPENEWAKWDWDPEKVREFTRIDPGTVLKMVRIRLGSSIVYHFGKKEYKEELHCFGHVNAKYLSEAIRQFDQQLNTETLQEKGVAVEVRTKFTNASRALEDLYKKIAEIEEKTWDMLRGYEGLVERYKGHRDALVSGGRLSPESSNLVIIRFPHTYRIIKQYAIQEIEERVRLTDRRGHFVREYTNKRHVVISFLPRGTVFDIYAEEIREKELERDELRQQMNNELREVNEGIGIYNDMISNQDAFGRIVDEIIRRERNNLRAIIESTEPSGTKANRIIGLFTHRDRTIDALLDDLIKSVSLEDIITSRQATENKIDEIRDVILRSLHSTSVVRRHLENTKTALRKSFFPKTEEGTIKTPEQTLADVRTVFSDKQTLLNIIDRFIDDNEEDIIRIINADRQERETDEAYSNRRAQLFTILLQSKLDSYADPIAGLKMKFEAFEAARINVTLIYESKTRAIDERLHEIGCITNRNEILNLIQRAPDNFQQRPEEVGFGLDENGYPLEIDPNTGEVLIDRWWNEISQNQWQLETIAKKIKGIEELQKHLGMTIQVIPAAGNNPQRFIFSPSNRPIRTVADKRFHGHLDLLDTGIMIYCDWDAVRDDLRDGRYHPHCKSAHDYVVEAMGGFDEKLGAPYWKGTHLSRRKGLGVTRRGIIPTTPINLHMNVNRQTLIAAKPQDFENVPADEKTVTGNYVMRLSATITDTGKRRAGKFNPSFDRRAQYLPYVHWSRMYYYEWASGLNKWTENPFPHISTRGIALYIHHLTVEDVYNYKESEDALKGHKFDYGVRGMGKFGVVNPASGEGILQEN